LNEAALEDQKRDPNSFLVGLQAMPAFKNRI
jgi:hypothetical protein